MACFQPGSHGPGAHLRYSPYVQPGFEGDCRCVTVDARIADIEPMAYRFLVNFAHDNDLQIREFDDTVSAL